MRSYQLVVIAGGGWLIEIEYLMSYSEVCRVVPCSNELILCFLCNAVTSIVGNSKYTDKNQYCEVIYYTVKGFCSGLN